MSNNPQPELEKKIVLAPPPTLEPAKYAEVILQQILEKLNKAIEENNVKDAKDILEKEQKFLDAISLNSKIVLLDHFAKKGNIEMAKLFANHLDFVKLYNCIRSKNSHCIFFEEAFFDELCGGIFESPVIKTVLIVHTMCLYIISISCPILFYISCEDGLEWLSHEIYGGFQVLYIMFSIYMCKRVRNEIGFWRCVTIFFDQLGALDLYLGITFILIAHDVSPLGVWLTSLIFLVISNIPIIILICLSFASFSSSRNFYRDLFIRNDYALMLYLYNYTHYCKKAEKRSCLQSYKVFLFLLNDLPQLVISLVFNISYQCVDKGGYTSIAKIVVSFIGSIYGIVFLSCVLLCQKIKASCNGDKENENERKEKRIIRRLNMIS